MNIFVLDLDPVKAAQAIQGLPPTTGGGQHAPGSVGAAFQPNNVNYSGDVGPAIGSRAYRALPQEQRQGLIDSRDQTQALEKELEVFQAQDSPNYSSLPTAKGGLENIPLRPDAHPMSKQTQGLPDPEAVKNTTERMDRSMPVQEHKPYAPNYADPFVGR